MPYPGGVGGPMARPIPFHSCLRLAFIFSKYTKNLGTKIFRKTVAFFGTLGGSPRSSPREGLGFAEGKAKSTSVFVHV